ncbi:hypothetical protein LJR164_004611 [Phenylobacterium sp. LjRoot164]|uniref:hypothetical protein n=1 Tax=unclassified Phenylobacterium TaxID=2640670 RepID=UPI003ECFA6E6
MSFATTSARFSIREVGSTWLWETFDEKGRPRQTGHAQTRRLAAAWVIFARTGITPSEAT